MPSNPDDHFVVDPAKQTYRKRPAKTHSASATAASAPARHGR